MKSPITTHILDTMRGKPAAGVPLVLAQKSGGGEWKELAKGMTDGDGRAMALLPDNVKIERGTYRLTFDTATYFSISGQPTFYPYVVIVFEVHDPAQHFHVPLLLSPYGYSTYRGT